MGRPAEHSFSSLVEPAFGIVAASGLRALTLRPLAGAAQMALSSVARIVPRKDELLQRLMEEARRRDASIKEGLLDVVEQAPPQTTGELALVAQMVVETQVTRQPELAMFLCEALLAADDQSSIAPALAGWLQDQRRFWRRLAALAGRHQLLADALLGLCIDEMAHGCALNGLSAYRQLRALCVSRLCSGDVLAGGDCESALFDLQVRLLGEMDDTVNIDRQPAHVSDARLIPHMQAASSLLVAEGAAAVTHRAVAQRAGVPSSTVAHHFPTHEDLVRGAMVHIIRNLKSSLAASSSAPADTDRERPAQQIVRSTIALALEAARRPVFLASAADMRRKRGINYREVLNRQTSTAQPLDALGAQTLSLVSCGNLLARNAAGPGSGWPESRALVDALLDRSPAR